jgi:hypothetical protein
MNLKSRIYIIIIIYRDLLQVVLVLTYVINIMILNMNSSQIYIFFFEIEFHNK